MLERPPRARRAALASTARSSATASPPMRRASAASTHPAAAWGRAMRLALDARRAGPAISVPSGPTGSGRREQTARKRRLSAGCSAKRFPTWSRQKPSRRGDGAGGNSIAALALTGWSHGDAGAPPTGPCILKNAPRWAGRTSHWSWLHSKTPDPRRAVSGMAREADGAGAATGRARSDDVGTDHPRPT